MIDSHTHLDACEPPDAELVAAAQAAGVPVPALSATLAYYDGYRAATLPANLIQAQRDAFGAHTYQRLDRPGTFHTEWEVGVEHRLDVPPAEKKAA